MHTSLHLRRSSRGLVGVEYGVLIAVFVALAIGFAAALSGVLRTGLEATETDFVQSDRLDVIAGPVTTPSTPPEVVAGEGLELVEGYPTSAVSGQPYHFAFRQFLRLPDGGDARRLTWSLTANEALPVGFVFDSATGVLSGTFHGVTPVELVLRVVVSDGNASAVRSYHWAARHPGLFLRPARLPFAGPGAPYGFGFERLVELPEGGRLEGLSWDVLPQTLPVGLTTRSAPPVLEGAFAGSLPDSGQVLVQVETNGQVASRTYTVETPPFWLQERAPLVVVSGADVAWDFRDPAFMMSAPGVDVDTLTWSVQAVDSEGVAVAMHEGLVVDGPRISGRLRAPVDTDRIVQVRASVEGWSHTRTYTLRIQAALYITDGALPQARARQSYSTDLNERLVVAPGVDTTGLVWSVADGTLPPGFSLNPQTGIITGRFAENRDAESAPIVSVSVPGGPRDTTTLSLPIVLVDALDDSIDLPTAYYGVPYRFDLRTILVARDPSVYRWELSGAPLPQGLSLDTTTGVVEGIPVAQEDRMQVPLVVIVRARADNPARVLEASYAWRVDGLTPWRTAAAGSNACALDERGAAWCWGRRSTNGMLGNPDTTSANALVPERVVEVPRPFVDLDMSSTTVCAIDDEGQIWCWGSNVSAQFGDGTMGGETFRPTRVDQAAMGLGATLITTGRDHTCAVSAQGEAWCWGLAGSGRLGNANSSVNALVPVRVSTATGMVQPITRIAAGTASTCAMEEDGELWCWGNGSNGRLGHGLNSSSNRPVRVATNTGMTGGRDIGMGNNHACALDGAGTPWCWGNFSTRKLGSDQTADQFSPIVVPLVNGAGPVNADRLVVSDFGACAYRDDTSQAWCWGVTNNGRLGNGSTASGGALPGLVRMEGTEGRLLGVDIGQSGASGCGWTDARAMYCWGVGNSGQLGTGTTVTTGTPTRVLFPNVAPAP